MKLKRRALPPAVAHLVLVRRHAARSMKPTIVYLVLAVAIQTSGFCCTCGPRSDVPQAFAEADAVFAGRCISAKLLPARDKDFPFERCQFVFEVTRTWKGSA